MFRSNFDHPQGDIFFTSVTKGKINFPEDGQSLTETCRRILKQYDHFNVLF